MDRPQSAQLRLGRFSESGRLYLLTCVALDRVSLFANFRAARAVVHELRRAQAEGTVRVLAWVVMPDHLHWLVELRSGDLRSVMRRVKSRSARAVNVILGRVGAVWQQGFHDRALRREEDVQAVARYIVLNPRRAGLVERVGDYPHWDAVWV